ncbi:MAG: ABC transporter ATP-binding protein, partial [Actinomycetales bacterium]|nr:ABC transporter ATP-binding protein [Actinomycetales bacterium]
HDRYLLERVTDSQYALFGDGSLRHLTGGVEQYLELRRHSLRSAPAKSGLAPHSEVAKTSISPGGASVAPKLSGADLRNAEKSLARVERALEKLAADETALHTEMAAHDQSDYAGLTALAAKQAELNNKREELELEWLETSEALG